MVDKKFLSEIPENVFGFVNNLRRENLYSYNPSLQGVTESGRKLELGFSTYALKIYYMTGEWDKLSVEQKNTWTEYIKSFQKIETKFPNQSFIDPSFLKAYRKMSFSENSKYLLKYIVNLSTLRKYDTKFVQLEKSINAETKQAISTLHQVGNNDYEQIQLKYDTSEKILYYLNNLDWSKPWTSGAQFASICVFNKAQELNYTHLLKDFASKIADKNTGSYFLNLPNSSREVINGAMKIISGLDWIEEEIHYPEKLIDYCIDNTPILEGCDIVDFVYVLHKCSRQVGHRKKEINNILSNLLDQLLNLYNKEDNSFSYFKDRSQTHYYGIEITEGLNRADIHGSTLCLWAIIMILQSLGIADNKLKNIKP